MLTSTFKVVLDACVLFPFSLRDTLLWAAHAGFYQPYWSAQILEEMRRNLVRTGTTTTEQAHSLVAQMRKHFPDALVTGHEALVPAVHNHEGDRHVVAAALHAHAQVIVTSNLKHFRARDLPPNIEAQHPDEFLVNLFDLDPPGIVALLKHQASALRRPPMALPQLLNGLAKTVPEFVQLIREELGD
ncbi:PIN domain-containing protein [Archangium violaceum]|uniref:PIN domain-containing protein n=1 Tax=Archangium violaceum TaxID=83451 RepID=UPI0007C6356E|nr:PIN domain-containing protein [Archangium violaceum]